MKHPNPKPNSKPSPAVASGANSHSRSNHRRATTAAIELQQQRPHVGKGRSHGRGGSAGQRHGRRPPARHRAIHDNAGSGGAIRSTGKPRHNEPTYYEDSSSGVDSIVSRGKQVMDLRANKFVPEQLETSSLVSMDSSSTSSSIDSVWSSSSAPVSMGMGYALSESKFGKLFRSADVALPKMTGGGRTQSSKKAGLLRQVLQGSRSQAVDNDEAMSPSPQPLLKESSSGSLFSSDGFTSESLSDSNVSTSASDSSFASDSSVASLTSSASGTSSKLTSLSVLLNGIGSSRGGSSTIVENDTDSKLCFDTMGKMFSKRRGCARMMVAVVGALVLATLVYLGAESNSKSAMDEMPKGSAMFGDIQGSQLRQPYQSLPQERSAMKLMIPNVVPQVQGNGNIIHHDKDGISSLELETTPTASDVVIPSNIPLISPQDFGRKKKAEFLDPLPNYKEKNFRRNKKAGLRNTPPKYKKQQKTNGNKLSLKELRDRNRKAHEDWGENSRN